MRISPEQGLQFSQMLVQDEEPLADITQVKKKTDHIFNMYSYHKQLHVGKNNKWILLGRMVFIKRSIFFPNLLHLHHLRQWWQKGQKSDQKIRDQNYAMATALHPIARQ